MQHIECTADDRNKGWCVFCGGPDETKDHVPSRVLLDSPLPDNPPTVAACCACNNSFSPDEEYLACLVECALSGTVEGAAKRSKIGGIFERSPALKACLAAARYETDGQVGFRVETDRVRTVIVKLARGHAAYEQNEPQLEDPSAVAFVPFTALSAEQRAEFEAGRGEADGGWPEVGSRAFTRAVLSFATCGSHPDVVDGWIVVQPGQYRYRVEFGDGCRVQMVLREYLAAEVIWTDFPRDLPE